MGYLIGLGSCLVVLVLYFIVWHIWGETGLYVLDGFIVLVCIILVLIIKRKEINDYYDN